MIAVQTSDFDPGIELERLLAHYAGHRKDAFQACKFMIDTLKTNAPLSSLKKKPYDARNGTCTFKLLHTPHRGREFSILEFVNPKGHYAGPANRYNNSVATPER
jgi:hypothetical protein